MMSLWDHKYGGVVLLIVSVHSLISIFLHLKYHIYFHLASLKQSITQTFTITHDANAAHFLSVVLNAT